MTYADPWTLIQRCESVCVCVLRVWTSCLSLINVSLLSHRVSVAIITMMITFFSDKPSLKVLQSRLLDEIKPPFCHRTLESP